MGFPILRNQERGTRHEEIAVDRVSPCTRTNDRGILESAAIERDSVIARTDRASGSSVGQTVGDNGGGSTDDDVASESVVGI